MITIRRLVFGVWIALCWAPVARAQNPVIDVGAITANSSGSACIAVPPGCAVFPVGNAAIVSLTLQVTGTYVGTLGAFEATSSVDPAATSAVWFAITGINLADGSSATGVAANSTGQFSFQNSGLTAIRARATAWTSGSAVVTAVRGYASARWLSPFFTRVYTGAGTCALPSWSFSADPDTGVASLGGNVVNVSTAGTCRIAVVGSGIQVLDGLNIGWAAGLTGGTASNTIFTRVSDNRAKLWDGSTNGRFDTGTLNATAAFVLASLADSATAPTISSGFGTSPSIAASNGTAAFTINVGTGGAATTGVIGLPTATTGWKVDCWNTTANTATVFLTKQTGFTTTTATIGNYDAAGAAAAWTASNVLVCSARGF